MDRDNKTCATCGWWAKDREGGDEEVLALEWCDLIGIMAFFDFTCQDWQETPPGTGGHEG